MHFFKHFLLYAIRALAACALLFAQQSSWAKNDAYAYARSHYNWSVADEMKQHAEIFSSKYDVI